MPIRGIVGPDERQQAYQGEQKPFNGDSRLTRGDCRPTRKKVLQAYLREGWPEVQKAYRLENGLQGEIGDLPQNDSRHVRGDSKVDLLWKTERRLNRAMVGLPERIVDTQRGIVGFQERSMIHYFAVRKRAIGQKPYDFCSFYRMDCTEVEMCSAVKIEQKKRRPS